MNLKTRRRFASLGVGICVALSATLSAQLVGEPDVVQDEPGVSERSTKADASAVGAGLGMLGLVCAGSTAIVVLVIVVFRRLARGDGALGGTISVPGMPDGSQAEAEPVATRVVDDGFWIDGELAAGATVVCRYSIGGQKHTVEITPSEAKESRFVRTGSQPEGVVASILSTPPY